MWRPSNLTPEQIEERRMECGRLLREGGLSPAEIARRLGVSRRAVSQWAQQILTANYFLRGVVAPEGKRRVETRYAAPAARRGAVVSALTLLALLGGAIITARSSASRKVL